MSLLKINSGDIRGFKFEKTGKLIKTSLQNIINQGNETPCFVEMELFGIDHVYSLIDLSKVKRFNLARILNEKPLAISYNIQKEYDDIISLSLSKIIDDCPVEKGVNMKSNTLVLDALDPAEWILLYQLKNIINGMNLFSDNQGEGISYSIGFGENIENEDSLFSLSKLDFSYSEKSGMYPFGKYKYILRYTNNDFEFCNEVYNDDFEGIFIYIPTFNCWQYLSKKKYKTLRQIKQIDIIYAITDSPRCFSNVGYHQEYNIDTFAELMIYGIYIPLDIYFNKLFEDFEEKLQIINNSYDAIEIRVSGRDYQTSVLLTHAELGINQTFGSKDNVKQNPYDVGSLSSCVRYMDRFCLIKLINKIILLKP